MNHTKSRVAFLLLSAPLVATSAAAQGIIYVDHQAAGLNDGSSWFDAYADLQDALDDARHNGASEIWIADGTYYPDRGTQDRTRSFDFVSGVSVRGGFAGTESSPDQRMMFGETTLKGDIGAIDNTEDNSFHVVSLTSFDKPTLLDYLSIRNGSAQGTGSNSRGGGLFVEEGIAPLHLNNVHLANNTADEGGGMYLRDSSVILTDCSFLDNDAEAFGGGAAIDETVQASLAGCYFGGNAATKGGGMYLVQAANNVLIDTSYFSSNTAIDGGGLYSAESTICLNACMFQHNQAANSGGGVFLDSAVFATLTDSSVYYNSANSDGGGVYLALRSEVEIEDSGFGVNTALRLGGGLCLNGNAVVRRSTVGRYNKSMRGGGIYLFGGFPADASLELSQSWLHHNEADEGGAVNVDEGAVTVDECEIWSNSAFDGAGLMARYSSVSIVRSWLYGNEAEGLGAAVFVSSSQSLIDRSKFSSNFAHVGGAVAALYDDLEITNSFFRDNHAAYAGAISAGQSNANIRNSTIIHNSADVVGGGIIGGVGASLLNSIVWNNTVDSDGQTIDDEEAQVEGLTFMELGYSLIENWTGNHSGTQMSSADPMFVDPDGLDGIRGTPDDNFRVRSGSPAIDSGDPSFASGPAEKDLDGHARVLCDRVDMGAYEFGIGDVNCDQLVNLLDMGSLSDCLLGPMLITSCPSFDFDGDLDVDLADFARVQQTIQP